MNEYASGDLALMLNADDYLTDKEFIDKAVGLFQRDQSVSFVFGDIKVLIEGTGELIEDSCNKSLSEINDGNELFLKYWKGYSLPHLTCLYDRTKAINIGFYTSESISSDLDSLFKLMINNKVGYINEPVGVLVRHQQNFTKSIHSFFDESATDYIDRPYQYGLKKKSLSKDKLKLWRRKMLKRYYFKTLVKLHYLSPDKIVEFQSLIERRHPDIYLQVMKDIRYKVFKFITKNPPLLRFLFRKIFKQESFITDLLVQRPS